MASSAVSQGLKLSVIKLAKNVFICDCFHVVENEIYIHQVLFCSYIAHSSQVWRRRRMVRVITYKTDILHVSDYSKNTQAIIHGEPESEVAIFRITTHRLMSDMRGQIREDVNLTVLNVVTSSAHLPNSWLKNDNAHTQKIILIALGQKVVLIYGLKSRWCMGALIYGRKEKTR